MLAIRKCGTCGRTVRQPEHNLFWLCVCKPVVSSCCFRERSTAWPSPSQTDQWWRRSLEGSWTVSTALRTPGWTATTWTATVKRTEVGVGSPGPPTTTHTQGIKPHLHQEVRLDRSMVALSCIPTLNGEGGGASAKVWCTSHHHFNQTTEISCDPLRKWHKEGKMTGSKYSFSILIWFF